MRGATLSFCSKACCTQPHPGHDRDTPCAASPCLTHDPIPSRRFCPPLSIPRPRRQNHRKFFLAWVIKESSLFSLSLSCSGGSGVALAGRRGGRETRTNRRGRPTHPGRRICIAVIGIGHRNKNELRVREGKSLRNLAESELSHKSISPHSEDHHAVQALPGLQESLVGTGPGENRTATAAPGSLGTPPFPSARAINRSTWCLAFDPLKTRTAVQAKRAATIFPPRPISRWYARMPLGHGRDTAGPPAYAIEAERGCMEAPDNVPPPFPFSPHAD